jgi:hypothetical protein
LITGIRDKKNTLYVSLGLDRNNQRVIDPAGQEKKFSRTFLGEPEPVHPTEFTPIQRRAWVLHKRMWNAANFEQLKGLLEELDAEPTLTCLGGRACTLSPETVRGKQPVLTITLNFPFSKTGGGLEQYRGIMMLDVHADCHRCAIQKFLAIATEDDLCIAVGPKDTHKLGLNGQIIENLKIYTAGRIES